MLTDRDDYIESLEMIALAGKRCLLCKTFHEVWAVEDIAHCWTPRDPRPTICKRCAS